MYNINRTLANMCISMSKKTMVVVYNNDNGGWRCRTSNVDLAARRLFSRPLPIRKTVIAEKHIAKIKYPKIWPCTIQKQKLFSWLIMYSHDQLSMQNHDSLLNAVHTVCISIPSCGTFIAYFLSYFLSCYPICEFIDGVLIALSLLACCCVDHVCLPPYLHLLHFWAQLCLSGFLWSRFDACHQFLAVYLMTVCASLVDQKRSIFKWLK